MVRLILILLASYTAYVSAEDKPRQVPSMSQEELEQYEFEVEDDPFLVGVLSVGQLHILKTHREEAKALIVRKLGILSIKGTKADIPHLQQIIDRRLVRQDETRIWQALGVLFGDVLASEYGMEWVRYQDKYGLSKALQWRRTDNFVFPIVMFSKRVGFKQKINVQSIFDQIGVDVEGFKAWELKPKLPNGLESS